MPTQPVYTALTIWTKNDDNKPKYIKAFKEIKTRCSHKMILMNKL